MKNTDQGMVVVQVEWVIRVRDVLYEIAHEDTEIGAEAELLGSYIPNFIESAYIVDFP